jgi:hypothetical protein
MHWLHEDDLVGHVLELAKESGETWETLILPGEAKEHDVFQFHICAPSPTPGQGKDRG